MAAENKDAKITLYWLEKSRSQRILWLLEELNVNYELQTFKRGADMLAPPELKKVHPLGKSPVIGVQAPGQDAELVIPESGAIVEYITEYFGPHLIPKRYKEGMEGKIGGETEEWLRYRHFMHYAEGSIMTVLLVGFVALQIRDAPVPFFLKPITRGVAKQLESQFLAKQYELHFSYLERQLATAPGVSGADEGYFCGTELTGADILMIFPLEAATATPMTGLTKEKHPRIFSYVERIQARESYKRAVQKIIDTTGEYNPNLRS